MPAPVAMRPTAAILIALALLVPVPAMAGAAVGSTDGPKPVEVRDCYDYPNGREIYVLGIGTGCIGPAAAVASTPPPIVERRKCDGNGQDGVEYFVLGHSLGCIQP